MDTQTNYDQATQRVEEKMGFFIHLVAYVVVNAALATLNLVTTPDVLWFHWPLAGWGIGVVLHGWKVFSAQSVSRVKQHMIQREIEQSEERPNKQPPTTLV